MKIHMKNDSFDKQFTRLMGKPLQMSDCHQRVPAEHFFNCTWVCALSLKETCHGLHFTQYESAPDKLSLVETLRGSLAQKTPVFRSRNSLMYDV